LSAWGDTTKAGNFFFASVREFESIRSWSTPPLQGVARLEWAEHSDLCRVVAVLAARWSSQTQGVFRASAGSVEVRLQMIFRLLAVSGVIKLPIGIRRGGGSAGISSNRIIARFEFASGFGKTIFSGLRKKSVAH